MQEHKQPISILVPIEIYKRLKQAFPLYGELSAALRSSIIKALEEKEDEIRGASEN
jgi:hypothetical protein